MNIKTTGIIASVLVIGLAVVPTTLAGHRHDRSRDPLVPLAFDVEQSARAVHKAAERMARHRHFRGGRALESLHELDRQSRYFRKVVERRTYYARDTRHAYRDLERAFRDAKFAMRRMHAPRPVRREFERLSYLMHRLDDRYDTLLAGVMRDRRGPRDQPRARVGRSQGTVRIGNSRASIGISWDD